MVLKKWPSWRKPEKFRPSGTCYIWRLQTMGVGGGGPIYALATTEPVLVSVSAVLWLDDGSAA